MKKARGLLLVFLAGLFFFGMMAVCRAEAPTLPLSDSIPAAEDALAKAKLKMDGYYLYGITLSNSSKGNYWSLAYRPLTPSERDQIYVKVYMDRTTEVAAPPGAPKTEK